MVLIYPGPWSRPVTVVIEKHQLLPPNAVCSSLYAMYKRTPSKITDWQYSQFTATRFSYKESTVWLLRTSVLTQQSKCRVSTPTIVRYEFSWQYREVPMACYSHGHCDSNSLDKNMGNKHKACDSTHSERGIAHNGLYWGGCPNDLYRQLNLKRAIGVAYIYCQLNRQLTFIRTLKT